MEKKPAKDEIIGKNIKIIGSKNKPNTGIEGKVIDETKNTLKIKTKNGTKTVIKQNITFTIKIGENEYKIKGEEIRASPEERIKTK
ncbi:ribonuclease P protein subunit [Candidatus Woesearchaeota archaeon]|nr:ribonuclease P protein subunit [Candidatus Woesearchaeota archaeon]